MGHHSRWLISPQSCTDLPQQGKAPTVGALERKSGSKCSKIGCHQQLTSRVDWAACSCIGTITELQRSKLPRPGFGLSGEAPAHGFAMTSSPLHHIFGCIAGCITCTHLTRTPTQTATMKSANPHHESCPKCSVIVSLKHTEFASCAASIQANMHNI